MPSAVLRFSDEQLRVATNLAQHYAAWMEAERAAMAQPYGMQWKTSSGRRYLYEILDRHGNGKSLGPGSPANEERIEEYRARKVELAAVTAGSRVKIAEDSRLWRALRLPRLASPAAAILREADRRGILGDLVMVVGTNAMPAYALEAGGAIREAPDTTDDFDMAWIAEQGPAGDRPVWDTLKAVDPTYTVNTERPFQARNRAAYEVEMLVAPSRAAAVCSKRFATQNPNR